MMKIKCIFILLFCCKVLFSQQNQGVVNYKAILIDTISNAIVQQDSIFMNFIYKPNKTLWESGLLHRPIKTKTIINDKDFYLLINEIDSKTAFHGKISDDINFNQLLNYKDTALNITKTTLTKTIAGRNCKKVIIRFKTQNPVPIIIWYDETVNCNSIIPGVGVNGKSVKGLILEYELPHALGKSVITANTIKFETVSNTIFNPNLAGYQITELERENGEQCNDHH